jgi:TrpR-related protein YerC/YecD
MAVKKGKIKKAKWDNKNTDTLARVFLSLKNVTEVKNFLRDVMTEPELIEFGNRLYAARMLAEGIYYDAISEETGLSTRTIARVQHWRKNGMGGYRTALARLGK